MNVKQIGQEYRTCPYNSSHQILPYRFQTHLVKCKRNYPDSNLQECPYNSTHLIPKAEYQHHKETCKDRLLLDKDYIIPEHVEVDKYPVLHKAIDTGESWDEVAPTYDPKKYCDSQPVLRKLDTASAAKRRDFRLEERKRHNDLGENKKSENKIPPGEGPPRIRRPQKASEVYPSVLEDKLKRLNINADVPRPVKVEKPTTPPIESKPAPVQFVQTNNVRQESPWSVKTEEEEFTLVARKNIGRGRGRHVANKRPDPNARV